MTPSERKWRRSPRGAYYKHRSRARARGIPFTITFEEWWHVWESSGHWEQRGCRPGDYVMRRIGDEGPYAADNVYIGEHADNAREGLGKANRVREVMEHYRRHQEYFAVGESHD